MTQPTALEIEERAAEARNILNSQAFNWVFVELQQEYLNELIQADVGGLTAATAHARMKVLGDVRARFESFITDQLMQSKKGRRTQ